MWTLEDEKRHDSSSLEWWCIESFFKTVEEGNEWSLKIVISEWNTLTGIKGSNILMTVFDIDNNKNYKYRLENRTTRLDSSEKTFHIRNKDTFIKGHYPRYTMHFSDKKNEIEIDMNYLAKSDPHWIAQDITDGILPMGLGFYRYGFIPTGDISGLMKIKDKKFRISGKGYFEHIWGDFTYNRRRSGMKIISLKKNLSAYLKLSKWWLGNKKLRLPDSFALSTLNNPLGYDWIWGLLDNGWSIFYGNILLWIMEGPAFGVLILFKNDKKYEYFTDINFKYTKTRLAQGYNYSYPTDIEINGYRGKERINLKFIMGNNCREFVFGGNIIDGGHWQYTAVPEAPGIVEGDYFDGEKKIKINGVCKIEPQRQIPRDGNNYLRIELYKPPKHFGISLEIYSDLLKKYLHMNVQLFPKILFNFKKKNT